MENRAFILDVDAVVFASKAFWATLKPVSLTLVLSSLTVVYLQEKVTNSSNDNVSVYTGNSKDGKSSSTGQEVTASVINALIIVGFITFFTFVLVLCYRYKCTKFITGYMIFALSTLFGLMGMLIFLTALDRWDLPCDTPTFFLVIYNFAIVGILSTFYPIQILPATLSQFYTLSIAIIMAWNLSGMSDWAVYVLLIFLAIYDLLSVCLTYGPLNLLVQEMKKDDDEGGKGQLSGLLYTAKLDDDDDVAEVHEIRLAPNESLMTSPASDIELPQRSSSDDNNSESAMIHHQHQQEEEEEYHQHSEIKLGLGDFIFYSLLVSKAAQFSIVSFFTTFLVIIMGLGLTMIFLTVMQKPLPALPFSILLGVVFYLLSRFFVQDFLLYISSQGLYI